MTQNLPPELVSADLDDGAVRLVVDESLYPLSAVYSASFVFIDRCYVFLERPDPDRLTVVLAPKEGDATAARLSEIAGEFSNELLSAAWRAQITRENRATIEAVTTQAIAGAMGPPSLDELEDFDFTEEPFEDPLGIAQSWEEKYQKKKPAADEPSDEGAKG